LFVKLIIKHNDEHGKQDFDMNFNSTDKWNSIDTQNKADVVSNGSFISMQIKRDGVSAFN